MKWGNKHNDIRLFISKSIHVVLYKCTYFRIIVIQNIGKKDSHHLLFKKQT